MKKFPKSQIPAASSGDSGLLQIATTAEVNTGTNNTKAITPALLKAISDTKLDKASVSGTPTVLNFGANQITKIGQAPSPLNVKFTPRHYVNLLGKDGNCEDVSKWRAYASNISVDSTNKVFGVQSVKASGGATNTSILLYRDAPFYLTKDKYYMASAYVKTSVPLGAIFLVGISANDDSGGGSVVASQNTKHTRVSFKFMATRDSATPLYVSSIGRENPTASSDVSMDGVMINEITATEYTNDTVETLMARYPYVDSLGVTKNIYLKSAHADGTSEECVIEGDFFTGDTIELKDGQVTGSKLWKYVKLFGKDFNTSFYGDYAGYKGLLITSDRLKGKSVGYTQSQFIGVKYEGSILKSSADVNFTNQCLLYDMGANDGKLLLTVSDTDSGWTDTLNPNDDEVKAFMNGWKAVASNGTRYIGLFNPIDNTLPIVTSTTNGTNAAGQNKINVISGSGFVIGRMILVKDAVGVNFYTISSIATNQLTVSPNLVNSVPDQSQVMMCDDGSTDLRVLTFCKSNVAPNYEGYQLSYKLATQQPINEDSDSYLAPLKGDVPVLKQGVNTVTMDTGVVLGEVANPTLESMIYFINDQNIIPSKLRNKAQKIIAVRKNGNINSNFTIENQTTAYGLQRAYCQQANFDTTATYTVDYEILDEIAPQIGDCEVSYSEGLVDSVNGLYEIVETKQNQSVALDRVTEAFYYEEVTSWAMYGYKRNAGAYVLIFSIPHLPKATKPFVTVLLDYTGMYVADVSVKDKFYLESTATYGNTTRATFVTTDSTTITNALANGVNGVIKVKLDCRGVI